MMRALFKDRERPLFAQADPLSLGPLPPGPALNDLRARYDQEGLDPGTALAKLIAFAAGHPQRTMLLAYLLADGLIMAREGHPGSGRRRRRRRRAASHPAGRTRRCGISCHDPSGSSSALSLTVAVSAAGPSQPNMTSPAARSPPPRGGWPTRATSSAPAPA